MKYLSAARIILYVCAFVLIFWIPGNESAPVSSYQTLSPRPGWVPVFIRKGDTPLEDINPELAEAFRHVKPRINHHKSLETEKSGQENIHGNENDNENVFLDNSVIPLPKNENDNEI